MSRPRLASLALCLLPWLTGPAAADLIEFTATLDSEQAIGCNGDSSPGNGTGSFVLDTDTGVVDYFIEFFDLSSPEIASHVHGPAGPDCQFANVLIQLPGGTPKEGTYELTPIEAADMVAGLHFILIHSEMWPVGEIRGQVLPVVLDQSFIRGDVDGDGLSNALVDSVALLSFGFSNGVAPTCLDAADFDDDGNLNALVDGVGLLSFGFSGGTPPPAPYPNCGSDVSADALTCVFSVCP